MEPIRPPMLNNYEHASRIEWIEADGVGGVSASSVIGVNTRKQHGVLSSGDGRDSRQVLVASLQEAVNIDGRVYDLSTNAYFGTIHPQGYLALDSFTVEPWPTWRYAIETFSIEKELIVVRGEHTVIARYCLSKTDKNARLVVRPLLAFRGLNAVRLERDSALSNWHVTNEFVECRPFDDGPTLFIAHPNALVETVGFWYRAFTYERDRESHLDCIEDLFHPGSFEMELAPGIPKALVFSTPSPRPVESVPEYLEAEKTRRRHVRAPFKAKTDAFFEVLLESADKFIYEQDDGTPGILPGLPWGEAALYRGLIAFPGLFLAARRFDMARQYLTGIASQWRRAQSPARFCAEAVEGEMHPVDAPLWMFLAGFNYWKTTKDSEFTVEFLLPLFKDVIESYLSTHEVEYINGLIEVGHEPEANYAAPRSRGHVSARAPVLPLGTNALWYNALRILGELAELQDRDEARAWREHASRALEQIGRLFACDSRPELADAVDARSGHRDETLRVSQILAVGLPHCLVADPAPVVQMIDTELATPVGPRTLSARDTRYAGDGSDVRLPKHWSGSVDPTWFGYYCDARKRAGAGDATAGMFQPFRERLDERGYGHIPGAYTGDPPHAACDYVASASGVGEILRIYARDVLRLEHMRWDRERG